MSSQTLVRLDGNRLNLAKSAFTTRHVPKENMRTLITENWVPEPGDLLLARVITLGQHKNLELRNGRRAAMFQNDEIIVCCGNRYAPDQFEAELYEGGWPTDLVAAGGIASFEISRHQKRKEPTKIETLGAIGDERGRVINVKGFAITTTQHYLPIKVILVVGTSMNSGKTTTAATLVNTLTQLGHQVGAAKVTGTGAGPDPWLMRDAGAKTVLDFTDGGYCSTYKLGIDQVVSLADDLINKLAAEKCDIAVVEIADGLLQQETAALLRSNSFRMRVFGTIFNACDSMGAKMGVNWLQSNGHHVLAVSGQLTASPLSIQEASESSEIPIFSLSDLRCPQTVNSILRNSELGQKAS